MWGTTYAHEFIRLKLKSGSPSDSSVSLELKPKGYGFDGLQDNVSTPCWLKHSRGGPLAGRLT